MKRVFVIVCLLAFAGTAVAGFSIGFNQVEMPYMIDVSNGELYTEDMNLLRFGAMASPEFRIEAYVGYMKETFELDPQPATPVELEGSAMAFGGGGYYVIEAPANTSFSFGARFLYATANFEAGTYEYETTAWCLDPLLRIDFAIPGAEQLAFFTEYGFRYASATGTTTVSGVQSTTDDKWSGLATYSPPNVLAGAYYIF
jgi:hypothetical protein